MLASGRDYRRLAESLSSLSLSLSPSLRNPSREASFFSSSLSLRCELLSGRYRVRVYLARERGRGGRTVRIDQGQVMSGDAVGITLGHLISMPRHDESTETEFIPFDSFRLTPPIKCTCFEFFDCSATRGWNFLKRNET